MSKRQTRKKDSLVGKFFHSFVDGKVSWQGIVNAEPAPGFFLIQLFEWLCGHPSDQEIIPIDQMVGWRFYDDVEDWREAADSLTSREQQELGTTRA